MNRYQVFMAVITVLIVGAGVVADIRIHAGWGTLSLLVPLAGGAWVTWALRNV